MESDVEQTLAQVEAGEAPVCPEGCYTDFPVIDVKMVRVIGPVGFSLKGGGVGWARNGYSRDGGD